MNPIMLNLTSNQQFFDPLRFGFEFVYSLVITILFLFIFYKTKYLFKLTKYDGIRYFRDSFLFFGLAYFSRFIYFIIRLLVINTSYHIPGKVISLISLIFITYLTTLAIGYLIYSSIWKKVKYIHFIIFINLLSLISIFIFYLNYSIIYFLIIQLFLMIILLFTNTNKNIKFVYPLISLFWIFNLIIFYSRRFLSFEIKIVFQFLSLILLSYFIYRILKWTK
jgi:hypothetical protein